MKAGARKRPSLPPGNRRADSPFDFGGRVAHTGHVQTPERFPEPPPRHADRPVGSPPPAPGRPDGLWALGERMTWVSGLVLALSTFMGWYTGSGDGLQLSVIGWNTGAIGVLVFLLGLAVLALAALKQAGLALPAMVPESLAVIALGSIATILVLIRFIEVPERFLPAEGRGIGLWISLAAALAVIAAGLLQASEEL